MAKTTAAEALRGVLDWWREAGIDHAFGDAPRDWLPPAEALAEPASPSPARSAKAEAVAPAPALGGDPAGWPTELAAFQTWWLAEPSLDSGHVERRVAPRGPAGAKLMVLAEYPEAEDAAQLLSGAQGRLLDGFLSAAGIAPGEVYVASALPRHMPLPDWAALDVAGLGAILARHIALAAPQQLIALGPNISSLLGHDPAKSAESLRRFNHEGANLPLLVAPGLDSLLARPRRKAALWQRWLDWTGPEDA